MKTKKNNSHLYFQRAMKYVMATIQWPRGGWWPRGGGKGMGGWVWVVAKGGWVGGVAKG